MKPIGIQQVSETSPVRADLAKSANGTRKHGNETSAARAAEPSMVARSNAADAGDSAPIDQERVAEIRQALKEGTYPLLPTKVADAMIAAKYILSE